MSKYEVQGRVLYDPKERALREAEEPIVAFLEIGLDYTLDQLEVARRTHKYGSCSDLQNQAMTLRDTIDAIRAGYHDKGHLFRVIDPVERAHNIYNRIPMAPRPARRRKEPKEVLSDSLEAMILRDNWKRDDEEDLVNLDGTKMVWYEGDANGGDTWKARGLLGREFGSEEEAVRAYWNR